MPVMSSARRVAALVAGLGTLAAAAACGGSSSTASQKPPALASITMAAFPGDTTLPDEVALKKGFFTQEGLNVKLTAPESGGAGLIQLTLGGAIVGGASDLGPVIGAVAQGNQLQIVGSAVNVDPFALIAQNKPWANVTGYRAKLEALKGKTVGITGRGSAVDLVLHAMLKSVGMNPDTDVRIVPIGLIEAAAGQFSKGSIDAYFYNVSGADLLIGKGLPVHVYMEVAKEAPPQLANTPYAFISSTKWVKAHPDLAKAWMRAEWKAVQWIRDPANLDEAAQILADYASVPTTDAVSLVKHLNEVIYPHALPDLKVPAAVVRNEVDLLSSSGVLKVAPSTPSLSYESLVPAWARTN